MKKIAVSQRVDRMPERGERRDALDQRMVAWLSSADYQPVPVPNVLGEPDKDAGVLRQWLETLQPAAVLLTGGNDIGDIPERDATERVMLQWAAEHSLPLLGICRGMQMMGVSGGAVLQRVGGHVRTRHRLELEGSFREVNSYHDFALVDCPQDYRVLARSEDGAIEAIRHSTLPWEGWMWHPEREMPPSIEDTRRLQALFGK